VAYNVADVEVAFSVADGGGPRGLIGKRLRPPPPLRTPTYRSNLGVQGAARPPVCKPAPGVVGGPVRG
jgi:hypothetical protein